MSVELWGGTLTGRGRSEFPQGLFRGVRIKAIHGQFVQGTGRKNEKQRRGNVQLVVVDGVMELQRTAKAKIAVLGLKGRKYYCGWNMTFVVFQNAYTSEGRS